MNNNNRYRPFLLLFCLSLASSCGKANFFRPARLPSHPINWACYYSAKIPGKPFTDYRLLVFDPDSDLPFEYLQARGTKVLAYISLGEVESYRDYYSEMKTSGLLLDPVPNWPDSNIVKFADPRWISLIKDRLVPKMIRKGYSGLFFDTIDLIVYKEFHPQSYNANIKALVGLLKAVRKSYPDTIIMVNRGFDVLPQIAPYIDAVLAEAVYSDYDFEKKNYYLNTPNIYQPIIYNLLKTRKEHNLHIFALEYWNQNDTKGIEKIKNFYKKYGISLSVSTIALDNLY